VRPVGVAGGFIRTCAALLNCELPAGEGEDSISMLRSCAAKSMRRCGTRPFTTLVREDSRCATRLGLHRCAQRGRRAAWSQNGSRRSAGYCAHLPGELFNLREDVAERHQPIRRMSGVVRELAEILREAKAAGGTAASVCCKTSELSE